jgi:uncharacterized membrane protein (DUF106 family)
MEHPFVNKVELDKKTLEELQETVSELTNKLTFAYRTGNGPMIQQLQLILETYKNQYRKKMDEIFEKQKLNNKINIQSENDHKN